MTSYDVIKDKFIKRLRGDKKFMSYTGVSNEDIEQLVQDHFLDLLNQSVDEIYKYDESPQIDFYDKDDASSQFNVELNPREIRLLVDISYVRYFDEDRNRLHEFMITFKNSELNVLSPANERNSFLGMVNDMESKVIDDIIKYLSTNRTNGKLKTSQTQIELRW